MVCKNYQTFNTQLTYEEEKTHVIKLDLPDHMECVNIKLQGELYGNISLSFVNKIVSFGKFVLK